MDGMHDIGGRQGFGPVVKRGNQAAFKAAWEKKINAISSALVAAGVYNMDEYRHAIERMEPRHYIGASYFERVFAAAATLCVEKGLITRDELDAAAGGEVPVSLPGGPGRVPAGGLTELAVGDRVRVKDEYVAGHVRMPAYVRGKEGVVVGRSPEYPFPDSHAHGLGDHAQCTYDVRFLSTDLWPQGSEPAWVHVGVFHAYLTKLD
ncbi:SH3-like domain-containing protein [Bordetella genomosp. 13]|uniref:SH3-like domain-containing protein n=1 Tax=Bordetella genomosp. 13 TaxID=463040 RepID=UPI00119E8826|nr:SH3-like domain-containing protein [Bordetella genomosp. 13]